MKTLTLIIATMLLLQGCAATYQAGVGYDLGDHTFTWTSEDGQLVGESQTWHNPVGIVGVSYPIAKHLVLDYRHISNMGGPDDAESNALSLLFQFKGSDLVQ